MQWRRQQLADEARTWATSSAASFQCRICERARADFCRSAWRASVSSSRIARYDSHSRKSHTLLTLLSERIESSTLLLTFFLFFSLFLSRIAHISISIYPSYILRSVVCVMFDRTYLLRTLVWGLSITLYLRPYYVSIILHYDLSSYQCCIVYFLRRVNAYNNAFISARLNIR